MFEAGKNLFRRFFPRLRDPLLDGEIDRAPLDDAYERAYREELAMEGTTDDFSRERYAEGRRWRSVLTKVGARSAITLDLGAGNGAVELSFRAADQKMVSVEQSWNETARRIHRRVGLAPYRVVADAAALPFKAEVFDAVMILETIEHLEQPRDAANEVMRTLKRAGVILITTPPRWRYVLRPDPHFGIRGLVALPIGLQRWVAARRGYDEPHHYVNRIYSSVREIERLFRGCSIDRILSRTRSPRRYFWDAITLKKAAP